MNDGLEFDVHVRPNTRRSELGGAHDGVLVVKVSAPPADGRANEAVCAAVAEGFGVRPAAVELLRGASSRRKRVRVAGDRLALAERLTQLLESRPA